MRRWRVEYHVIFIDSLLIWLKVSSVFCMMEGVLHDRISRDTPTPSEKNRCRGFLMKWQYIKKNSFQYALDCNRNPLKNKNVPDLPRKVQLCKAGERWRENRKAEANKFGEEENDEGKRDEEREEWRSEQKKKAKRKKDEDEEKNKEEENVEKGEEEGDEVVKMEEETNDDDNYDDDWRGSRGGRRRPWRKRNEKRKGMIPTRKKNRRGSKRRWRR